MKRILVTGLCTLHWGRLQYGNVGNYYIIEPLFRELHKFFDGYEILTTFQMDDEFCEREEVRVLPMSLYYSWSQEDVNKAYNDVENAKSYMSGSEVQLSDFNSIVNTCNLVLNVSGDMWGDNAEHVGHDRFLVDCLKMKAAQILNVKTVLYAVTPGPFSNHFDLAKEVFENFDKVYIRETISRDNLIRWGLSVNNVKWFPCPSYLFEPNAKYESQWIDMIQNIKANGSKVIGFTFGGFNLPIGPYDMWPRDDDQYDSFVKVAQHILDTTTASILIFSHTNGFELPPKFKLINGRDFIILNQFYRILAESMPQYKERIVLIDEPMLPCNLKSIIGHVDILITGRVHASVAGTSQYVPTVYIEYDRNVVYSDKMLGFSSQIGMQRFVCEPQNTQQIIDAFEECYSCLDDITQQLHVSVDRVKCLAEQAIEELYNYVEN